MQEEIRYFVEDHDHVLVGMDFYEGCDCADKDSQLYFVEAMTLLTNKLFAYHKNGYTVRFDPDITLPKMQWECESGLGSIVTVAIDVHESPYVEREDEDDEDDIDDHLMDNYNSIMDEFARSLKNSKPISR